MDNTTTRKEKRPPSITPRKFTRFFTPRARRTMSPSSSSRILSDITNSINRRNGVHSSPLRPSSNKASYANDSPFISRHVKKRKLFHSPGVSTGDFIMNKESQIERSYIPDEMSVNTESCVPSASPFSRTSLDETHLTPDDGLNAQSPSALPFRDNGITWRKSRHRTQDEEDSSKDEAVERGEEVGEQGEGGKETISNAGLTRRRIRTLHDRGIAGQLLQLSINSEMVTSFPQTVTELDYQYETAAFYSGPEDAHLCRCLDRPDRCIPFCVASCNTNTLVAVGDEEGRVRLLESAKVEHPAFKDAYLSFRPHTNAIIDMCLSDDDSLIATASGDQTAQVIDMRTQTTTHILAQHSASLKQVRFQPGRANNSVLATSSRDGTVQLWDLRCRGSYGPMQNVRISLNTEERSQESSTSNQIKYGCAISSISGAHRDSYSREVFGRVGDVSVTAISFLPPGQEHLLLTGSEANAAIKLWDLRSLNNTRKKLAIPVSSTRRPENHSNWRHFGISSMSLSGDGSRLYALCKDNTVYAYSVNHLIMGRAPEFSDDTPLKRRYLSDCQEGLGPLYGFRHPSLHVTSFYVKSAIRPARNGNTEMLAVGSSDGCAVLFPTDERFHKPRPDRRDFDTESVVAPQEGDVNLSWNGTPLIRGHDREVGSLTWTSEGELVTVGDDYLVRCWREGTQARDLRQGGEQEGRRWASGWADVEKDYDEDDL